VGALGWEGDRPIGGPPPGPTARARTGAPRPAVIEAGRFLVANAKRWVLLGDVADHVSYAVGCASLGTSTSHFSADVGVSPTVFRRLPDLLAASPPRLVWPSGRGLRPSGAPVSGTLLAEPGPFHLGGVPGERWWPLGAFLPTARGPAAQLLPALPVVEATGPLRVGGTPSIHHAALYLAFAGGHRPPTARHGTLTVPLSHDARGSWRRDGSAEAMTAAAEERKIGEDAGAMRAKLHDHDRLGQHPATRDPQTGTIGGNQRYRRSGKVSGVRLLVDTRKGAVVVNVVVVDDGKRNAWTGKGPLFDGREV